MRKLDVARAWKDEDYRMSLSDDERRTLPTNPAGLIEISDNELGAVAGGIDAPGSALPAICSCFGGCPSEFYEVCTADWKCNISGALY
jgi:mersacidin/lichenicidin family type 2 lantibiotic